MRYGGETRETAGYYYVHTTGFGDITSNFRDPWSEPLTPHVQLFFVDTEPEADRLIVDLAKANPGMEYGKAHVSTVAVTPPSQPVMSKYTEKGLLPL